MYDWQSVDQDTFNKHLQQMQEINEVATEKIGSDTSVDYGYYWDGKFIPVLSVRDALSEKASYRLDADEYHKSLVRMTPLTPK